MVFLFFRFNLHPDGYQIDGWFHSVIYRSQLFYIRQTWLNSYLGWAIFFFRSINLGHSKDNTEKSFSSPGFLKAGNFFLKTWRIPETWESKWVYPLQETPMYYITIHIESPEIIRIGNFSYFCLTERRVCQKKFSSSGLVQLAILY